MRGFLFKIALLYSVSQAFRSEQGHQLMDMVITAAMGQSATDATKIYADFAKQANSDGGSMEAAAAQFKNIGKMDVYDAIGSIANTPVVGQYNNGNPAANQPAPAPAAPVVERREPLPYGVKIEN